MTIHLTIQYYLIYLELSYKVLPGTTLSMFIAHYIYCLLQGKNPLPTNTFLYVLASASTALFNVTDEILFHNRAS